MSGRGNPLLKDELAWLLVIGRRLEAEYNALAKPMPPVLATLLRNLEAREKRKVSELSGSVSSRVDSEQRAASEALGDGGERVSSGRTLTSS
jgi:hypothetical protein